MKHAAVNQPLFTPPMLDSLLERWQSLPYHDAKGADALPAARMNQARAILKKTVEGHLPHMGPDDRALYARFMASHEPQAWNERLFDCFDLMARTRGAVIAVLHLRDLYCLLRPTDTAPAPAAMPEPSLAHA